ncbi:hypothetical protein GGS23DRAFT_614800 [Durotheca rogersii]|uniref:uncharacterized protein n=1 Tax=Durotheca rogersii TaxID=419775 RepID=UPI00221FE672|nr:uncharacterized protein GGS23DRAFT_614800 [Durotheca rogersii]KAI5859764.1 hypothetical protein GGS23DRAFT_614800 [Durotheca rogersii]
MSHAAKSVEDTGKTTKRKGTRSVSTLTPAQLARKRANDREAQRAIRARTKEHIESLEREIEKLRGQQNRDHTIQTLIQRNKALEDELRRTREGMGFRNADTSDAYQPLYHGSSPPRPAPFSQSASNYPVMQTGLNSYGSIPDGTEAWSSAVPCSIPSTASSPASSGATDDFGNNYIATSGSSAVFEKSRIPPMTHSPTMSCVSGEAGFDDVKSDFGCPPIDILPINPTGYHYQPWNMYNLSYHPPSTALEHGQISQMERCQF